MEYIGSVFILFCLAYLVYYFVQKRKSGTAVFLKKPFFIVLVVGMVFFSIGLALDDGSSAKISALEETNETLTKESKELDAQIIDLDDELNALHETTENLEEEVAALTEENESLSEEVATLEEDHSTHLEDIAELEEEKEKLQKKITTLEDEKKQASATKTDSAASESSSTNESSSSTSSSDNSNQANAKSSEASDTECKIKGSESGIYHVPGSTYYDRTKNVVQWFCSEEEAKNAGYRAPKR